MATKVLIVDDSVTVRKITSRLLERHGYNVKTARDGVEATEILDSYLPHIILLDVEMPRMDGYELAQFIRDEPQLADIPIIMITSRSGEKHRERAEELQVNEYLGKPFKENQLLEVIEQLVNRGVKHES